MKVYVTLIAILLFISGCVSTKSKYVDVIFDHTYSGGCTRNYLNFCGELIPTGYKNSGLKGYVNNLKAGSCKDNNIKATYLNEWQYTYYVFFDIKSDNSSTKPYPYDRSYILNGQSGGDIHVNDTRMSDKDFQLLLSTHNLKDNPMIY